VDTGPDMMVDARRKGAMRTVAVLALVALAIYVAFILRGVLSA